MQIESIEKYAVDKNDRLLLFSEKERGGKADRKELKKALELLQQGDTFVIYKLDRLARSTK
jgi:DNA invertase Pin-like site-specific DNA recombinase